MLRRSVCQTLNLEKLRTTLKFRKKKKKLSPWVCFLHVPPQNAFVGLYTLRDKEKARAIGKKENLKSSKGFQIIAHKSDTVFHLGCFVITHIFKSCKKKIKEIKVFIKEMKLREVCWVKGTSASCPFERTTITLKDLRQNILASLATCSLVPRASRFWERMKEVASLEARFRPPLLKQGMKAGTPTYLTELISPYVPMRALRSADQLLLEQLTHKLKLTANLSLSLKLSLRPIFFDKHIFRLSIFFIFRTFRLLIFSILRIFYIF